MYCQLQILACCPTAENRGAREEGVAHGRRSALPKIAWFTILKCGALIRPNWACGGRQCVPCGLGQLLKLQLIVGRLLRTGENCPYGGQPTPKCTAATHAIQCGSNRVLRALFSLASCNEGLVCRLSLLSNAANASSIAIQQSRTAAGYHVSQTCRWNIGGSD